MQELGVKNPEVLIAQIITERERFLGGGGIGKQVSPQKGELISGA
jgi:hypothetical protein